MTSIHSIFWSDKTVFTQYILNLTVLELDKTVVIVYFEFSCIELDKTVVTVYFEFNCIRTLKLFLNLTVQEY